MCFSSPETCSGSEFNVGASAPLVLPLHGRASEKCSGPFTQQTVADLPLAIATINSWNRLSIDFRVVPGTYQPRVEARVDLAYR